MIFGCVYQCSLARKPFGGLVHWAFQGLWLTHLCVRSHGHMPKTLLLCRMSGLIVLLKHCVGLSAHMCLQVCTKPAVCKLLCHMSCFKDSVPLMCHFHSMATSFSRWIVALPSGDLNLFFFFFFPTPLKTVSRQFAPFFYSCIYL